MGLNLAAILRESARANPDKPVVLFDGGSLTYSQLDDLSNRCAAGLRREGIQPKQAVGLQLPNIPQFVIAYFGILKAGGVVVPMNVLLRAPEMTHQVGDSRAVALITWSGTAAEAAKGAKEAGLDRIFVVSTPGSEAAGIGRPFEELLAGEQPERPIFEATEPSDTAAIVYTSGTTGRPKGAELSHFQLFMNAETPGRLFGIRDDDVVLIVLPLFHVFGLSSELNVCVRFGATMSLIARFDVEKVLEVIQRDRITIFEGVPTMYIALLHYPKLKDYDLSSLRIGVSGGAPIPAEVIDAVEERFGIVILEGYGMTETASTISFNVSAAERKIYSVGKPVWGVDVEFWDEQGRPLPDGPEHVGELVVRGVNTPNGYFRNPEATAEAFAGGWFHTGDLGYRDEDGFLFIVDRKKDLIIRGGYNVYPREVEEVLHTHPSVAEAAVIGVPHDRLGEDVKAFIQLKPGMSATEDELIAYAKDRLSAYKYPRSIEFREALPLNATGKVAKKELRADHHSSATKDRR